MEKYKRTLFVIGGSSYVGRYLCILGKKEFEVCYTYFKNPIQIEGCRGFTLNITDRERVINLVNSVLPDVIYHTAYDSANLWASIVKGTSNLICAFKKVQERFKRENKYLLPKFFFLSTDAVFDGGKGNYYEQEIPLPIWDYSEAKLKAEEMVLSNSGTVVRTSLVYGFDPLDSRTRDLFLGLQGKKPLMVYFEDEYRCPIYVLDLCKALLELSKIDSSPVLHVAGPKRLSRYEFAVQLAQAMGFKREKVKKGYQKDSGLIRPKDVSMNISLAQKLLKTKLRSPGEVLLEGIPL